MADVTITFTNDLPANTQAPDLALELSEDGSGDVTLDASTSSADGAVLAAVNAWDGAVGTVSYAPAFGTSFTIGMDGTGDEPRLTTQGNLGGLGAQGLNQNKLDQPGVEEIYATAVYDGYVAALDVKSMEWTGARVEMRGGGGSALMPPRDFLITPRYDGGWVLGRIRVQFLCQCGGTVLHLETTTLFPTPVPVMW